MRFVAFYRPQYSHVMALTATATITLRTSVMKTLSMWQAAIVVVSPDKCNIKYSLSLFSTVDESFRPIIFKLLEESANGSHDYILSKI